MMNACLRWSMLGAPLLLSLGCSDPVPPPAQGALNMSISQAADPPPGMACPDSGTTYRVAATDSKTKMIAPPDMGTPGESVISGEAGSSISCSVTGSNGNFKFSGSLHGITPEGYSASVVFSNGQIGADFTGSADVSISTSRLAAQTYVNSVPCSIKVLPPPNTSSVPPQIKGGSMWAEFSCPQLSYPPSGLCQIGSTSVVVFENCSGS
ncbi:MAG TPA: hypothetical protein VGM44_13095 [Polyangiaceae bacterium]